MIDYSGVDTEFLAGGGENIMVLKACSGGSFFFFFFLRTGQITKRDGSEFYIPYISHTIYNLKI